MSMGWLPESMEWLPEERDRVLAAARLERQPDEPMAWHCYGLALALCAATDDLLALCERAASRFGSSLRFFQNVILDLARHLAWTEIERLEEAVPRSRPEYVVVLYYRGCAEVARGRPIAALERFSQFKAEVSRHRRHLPFLADQNFNLIVRQGTLVEPPRYVRELAAGPPPPPHRVVFVEGPAEAPAPFVAVSVLDRRYFARFGGELCAGHQALGTRVPLHFHILAADSTSLALGEDLRRRHPGLSLRFSHEPPGPWDHPVYYTCARFLVMPALIERYRTPIMTLDADILPTLPLESFAAAAAEVDFACFEMDRSEPASVYQASLMIFEKSAASLAFIDDLCRFVRSKLDIPPPLSWMLDQAALYSVLTERSVEPSGFRFRPIDRTLGKSLNDAIRQLSTTEEKSQIMNRRG